MDSSTWMSRWKLGSMVRKWVISPTVLINGLVNVSIGFGSKSQVHETMRFGPIYRFMNG